MKKFWLVFAHEYWRQVNQKSFFLALLSLPLLGVAFGLVIVIDLYLEYDLRPVGYVDRSGLIRDGVGLELNEPQSYINRIQILRFEDEDNARQALETDRIQVYYVLAEDYPTTGEVRTVAKRPPSVGSKKRFSYFFA